MHHRLTVVLLALSLALTALVAAPGAARGLVAGAADGPAACGAARVDVTAATLRAARDATLCLLNRERAARRLKPLRLHKALDRVARAHSRDMVRRRFFDHESPDGRSPFDRMLATRYVPAKARWRLGENIAWGTLTLAQPAAIVQAWMESPGHRANILNGGFREIGIGIVIGVPVASAASGGQPGATYTTDFGAVS